MLSLEIAPEDGGAPPPGGPPPGGGGGKLSVNVVLVLDAEAVLLLDVELDACDPAAIRSRSNCHCVEPLEKPLADCTDIVPAQELPPANYQE